MRYLVTGGAGFIGSALVHQLRSESHDVVVLDNMTRGNQSRLADHVPGSLAVYKGDVRDYHAVVSSASGCDAIIHLAYLQGTQAFYSSPVEVLDVATRGMLNVLDACEKHNIRDLMVVSSSEAYQVASVVPTPETIPLTVPDVLNPRYSYGGGKILWEIMANAWGSEGKLDRVIIARPHNIIGPDMGREHVVPQFALRMKELAAGQPHGVIDFPIQGTGQETRSFCYITDLQEQLSVLLSEAPGGVNVYHVGAMDERTVAEVAREVARCFGREILISPGELWKGSPSRRLPDTSKISGLGYEGPEISFAQAIKCTVAWYQQNG